MRKKIVIILASTVAVLVAGYSAVWFYGAYEIKNTIISYVEATNKKDNNLQMSYASMAVSGFPGIFQVTVDKPLLTQSKDEEKLVIQGDKLVLFVNPHANSVKISPVGKIAETFEQKGLKKTAEIQYNLAPVLKVQLKSRDSWKKSLNDNDFINEVKDIRYADHGLQVVDSDKGRVISESGSTIITVQGSQSAEGKRFLNLQFALRDFETKQEHMPNKVMLPGKITAEGDIAFTATVNGLKKEEVSIKDFSKAEFDIAKLVVSSGEMSVSLHGQVSTTRTQFLPSGEVTIEVTQIQKLLDYLASANLIKNAAETKIILEEIAEQPKKVGDMNFIVKGKPTEIRVGKLRLEQIIARFHRM